MKLIFSCFYDFFVAYCRELEVNDGEIVIKGVGWWKGKLSLIGAGEQ